jgi:hypothetical protein
MSRLWCRFLYDRDTLVTVAFLAVILAIPRRAFAWGREGHQIIAIVAEHYMRPEAAARVRELLTPRPNAVRPHTGPESRAPSHRETGTWHSIDIRDSKIDLARECPSRLMKNVLAASDQVDDVLQR